MYQTADRRDDAVALIALVKLQRMSRPKAWRKLFPQDAEQSDNVLSNRALRLERWHANHFPSNLFEMMTRNHLGIPLKAIIRSRSADGGTVTFRASKTDQQGTVAAVQRYLDGPLFRRIRKGGQVTADRLGADSARR